MLKFKQLSENAVLPKRAHRGDAGYDLVSTGSRVDTEFGYVEHSTGLAVEIPEGYVGLLLPRSSISNTEESLSNSVGVIDNSFRGHITLRFKQPVHKLLRTDMGHRFYKEGDKIGQLVIVPIFSEEAGFVKELSNSTRGANGYGSSGK